MGANLIGFTVYIYFKIKPKPHDTDLIKIRNQSHKKCSSEYLPGDIENCHTSSKHSCTHLIFWPFKTVYLILNYCSLAYIDLVTDMQITDW